MKNILVLIMVLISFSTLVAQNSASKPYQFIAKIYSECLGTIPAQSAWNYNESNMTNTSSYFIQMIKLFYEGAETTEFKSLYPLTDSLCFQERLLPLYRGALNRDPDSSGFYYYLNLLQTGQKTWDQVVDIFTGLSEFNNLINYMIGNAQQGFPYYGWDSTTPPLNINYGSNYSINNFKGSENELQQLLYNNQGKTITLAPMTVITLTKTLEIPPYTTLATAGNPTHNHYAKMGRIVRGQVLNGDMVMLSDGSKLTNVWIDGQRTRIAVEPSYTCVKVDTTGSNIDLSSCRLTDASGWAAIYFMGARQGCSCSNDQITSNLLTGYGTDHVDSWSGGIVAECENTLIQNNQIIDITDGGINIFASDSSGTNHQYSQVDSNMILNAGNSNYYGIDIDPEVADNGLVKGFYAADFSGTNIHDNIIWTSPDAHIDNTLAIGSHSYYLKTSDRPITIGLNGKFQNNNSGACGLTTDIATFDDGWQYDTVMSNNFNIRNFGSFYSRPVGNIKSSDPNLSIINETNMNFLSFAPDSNTLANYNHANGIYITGPDTILKLGSYTYGIAKIKAYQLDVSNYGWTVEDLYGNWIESINGTATINISTSSSTY